MSELQKFLDRELQNINLDSQDQLDKAEDYDILQELAGMLTAARVEAGLTQDELAKLCGISQANISKYETGSSAPTLTTLKKIANGMRKRLVVTFVDNEDDA